MRSPMGIYRKNESSHPIIMAKTKKGKRDKVVLAYSGGLDTSVAIH